MTGVGFSPRSVVSGSRMLRRLAWRWPMTVAVAIFVAANVVGAFVALRGQSAVERALEDRATAVARGLEHRCHDAVVGHDAPAIRRCLQALWEEQGVSRVAVVDTHGEVVAEEHPRARGGEPLTVRYAAADHGGEVRSFVVVDVDPRAADRATRAARREAVVAALAFALVGVALSIVATRRVVRPLRRLAAAEAAIAGGDRSARVPVEGPDETRVLAGAFNTMVDAIRERDEQLQRRGDELQASLDRERALEGAKRSLTAMIVHDLRSPVGAARSVLGAVDASRLDEGDRDMMGAAARRLDTALAMAGDLLEVSRLEQAERPLSRERVDLGALCRELAAAPWPDTEGNLARIVLDVPDEALEVNVEPRLVERAVANLLGNAVRHAGAAGPVRLRVARVPAGVQIAVEDRGPGVPDGERERIFQPFERGSARRGEGAGIGLALCARVATAHGGRVWVQDGPDGQGARFVLELPTEGS